MDEIDSQFAEDWTKWAALERREIINLPDGDVDALAHALMAMRTAIQGEVFHLSYSGPLVDHAMRKWKPPMAQLFVSLKALDYLRRSGVEKDLWKEHDPPVSFYRDLVRYDVGLKHERLAAYLRRLKVTSITEGENDRLDEEGFRSVRPPDAYQQCGIQRLPYDPHVAEALSRR
jgi:hypothetical protein